MFNLFKRDPAQEKLKIPIELFSVTLAGASNACNILNLAIFNANFFSREEILAEVCGAHVKVVIATMSRMEGFAGSIEERFDKSARFLRENLPSVLNRIKDPKMLSGFQSRGFKLADLALMERLLIADKTFDLAASYYMGIGLDVSDEDVLDYARKYNPKLLPMLTLSSDQLSNTIFAYIIRCVRLAHIDAIPDKMRRTSILSQFNDTLMQAFLEMEQKVEKLMPKN